MPECNIGRGAQPPSNLCVDTQPASISRSINPRSDCNIKLTMSLDQARSLYTGPEVEIELAPVERRPYLPESEFISSSSSFYQR